MRTEQNEYHVFDEQAPVRIRKYLVLVIYDISCNRKRTKLAKLLESFGIRVQKSAFESILNKQEYLKLLKKITRVIDEAEDYVRVYKFTGSTEMKTWGKIGNLKEEDFIII